MATRPPIGVGEWYHCFNRGVDKRKVFMEEDDCNRFLLLLYLCNDEDINAHILNLGLKHMSFAELMDRQPMKRRVPLVEIGAYAVMPNHLHFVIRQTQENGLGRFMQKVFTGYTMYFNKKYDRTGALFAGSYKSKHIATDEYFKHALHYVHFNPAEVFSVDWKKGKANLLKLKKDLMHYSYSSMPDFYGQSRPENKILYDVRTEYFDRIPKIDMALRDAQLYYRQNVGFIEGRAIPSKVKP